MEYISREKSATVFFFPISQPKVIAQDIEVVHMRDILIFKFWCAEIFISVQHRSAIYPYVHWLQYLWHEY